MSIVSFKTKVAWFQSAACFKSDEKKIQKADFQDLFHQKLGNFKAFYRIRIRSESLVDSAESESSPNLLDSAESESESEYSVDH